MSHHSAIEERLARPPRQGPAGRWPSFRLAWCLARLGRLALAWCLLVALADLQPAGAQGTVRDIRVIPHEKGVRVLIDLNQRAPYSYLLLPNPPRLAFDLPEVSWLVPSSRGERPAGMVKGFRFGLFRPGTSRLVLDLAGPFDVSRMLELAANDASGFRIVAELAPLPPGTPMAPRLVNGGRPASLAVAEAPRPIATPAEAQAQQLAMLTAPRAASDTPVPMAKPSYPLAPRVVVLDPGHGGVDPGALGLRGTREKNVVLAAAREVRRQLEATGRYRVVLTRSDDTFVPLRDRLQIARTAGGELFMSLHADSLVKDRSVSGGAVYTLSERASSEEAARLANDENRADILGGLDLSNQEAVVTQILIDLAQRDANNKSIELANTLVNHLNGATHMLRKQRQQAGFVVLKSPDMPSVLLELGYLSNAGDERRLTDPTYLARLASAIVQAVDKFFRAESS